MINIKKVLCLTKACYRARPISVSRAEAEERAWQSEGGLKLHATQGKAESPPMRLHQDDSCSSLTKNLVSKGVEPSAFAFSRHCLPY